MATVLKLTKQQSSQVNKLFDRAVPCGICKVPTVRQSFLIGQPYSSAHPRSGHMSISKLCLACGTTLSKWITTSADITDIKKELDVMKATS